jgi:hypothetical protein
MTTINEKLDHAFDETTMLILGVQVLIGFQFQSMFQTVFDRLPAWAQYLKLGGLCLLLFAFAWLIAPAAYQCLTERGHDTQDLNQFTIRAAAMALLPFSLGIAIEFFIAGLRIQGEALAWAVGLAALFVTFIAWYGLEVFESSRRRAARKGERAMIKPESEKPGGTPLAEKIDNVLAEARMVLPGAQALLGFQLAMMFVENFDKLPEQIKYIHLGGLAAIGVSMVLLMTPAAYHRIVEAGENSESFHRLASRLVLAAMAFLALGLATEFLVVVDRISGSITWGLIGAGLVLILFYGLWFGYSLYSRQRLGKAGRISARADGGR